MVLQIPLLQYIWEIKELNLTNQILVIATGKQALIMRSNMEYKTEGPVKSTGTSILVNDIEFMFYSASYLNKDPLIIYLMHLDECFVVDEEPLTEEVIETTPRIKGISAGEYGNLAPRLLLILLFYCWVS